MTFKYFRFVITILASFSGFMAYQGRFNLNLLIENMVYKNNSFQVQPNNGEIFNGGQNDFNELKELALRLPSLRNEEQTLAQLSMRVHNLRRHNFTTNDNLKFVANNSRPNHRISFQRQFNQIQSSGKRLSIELDVNPTITTTEQSPVGESVAPSVVVNEQFREQNLLNWTIDQRNTLQGAFFLGYVLFMIPAGRAAEIFGPKTMFLTLGLGTGLASLVFPFAASAIDGSIALAWIVRFAMGISQAGLFPAAYVLLCKWLPRDERSKWLPITGTASRMGMVIMNKVVPIIFDSYGWEMVFYISGSATIFYGILFLILGSNTPATSCWISEQERIEIESRISMANQGGSSLKGKNFQGQIHSPDQQVGSCVKNVEKIPPINWLKLITNRAMLMLALVMFTAEWGSLLLLIKLPGFLGPALRMDLQEIGDFSMYLNLIFCLHFPLSGFIASYLENAQFKGLTTLRIRKIFELTANGLQAIACLIIATFNDKLIVKLALIMLMIGRSTVGGGSCIMPPELSRDYPGSLVALANSMANIAGIIGPEVVTLIVGDKPEVYENWTNLWLLSAVIFTFGGTMFCLFAQNKPQDFSKKPKYSNAKCTTSQANLVNFGGSIESLSSKAQSTCSLSPPTLVAEEMIKMDAYSRVSSAPTAIIGQRDRKK